jgi:hypothetical protein
VLADHQDVSSGIAVDASYVYWTTTTGAGASSNAGAVMRCPLGGCGSAPSVFVTSTTATPVDVVVDDANVYWSAWYTFAADGSTITNVMKTSVGGGGTTQLAVAGDVVGLGVDATSLYWLDDAYAYHAAKLMKCAIAGCNGTPTTLVSGLTEPTAMVVAGGDVFWTDVDNNLNACSVDGCANPRVLVNATPATDIVADSHDVYWVSAGGCLPTQTGHDCDGWVSRCELTGCGGATVLESHQDPISIAVDGASVYWGNQNDGTIFKISK